MLRFFRRMPIKMQLMLLAGSTGIIIFSLFMFVYIRISNVITNNNYKYTNEFFNRVNSSIDEKCRLSGQILSNVAYNSGVQKYLMETDDIKKFDLTKDISNMLINMQDLNNKIADMYVRGNNGGGLFLHGGVSNIKSVIEELPENINNYYTEVKELDYNGAKKECFIIATTVNSIIDEKNPGARIGVALIILKAEALGIDAGSADSGGPTFFYLLDRNNKVYSSNTDKLDLYESLINTAEIKLGSYVAYKDGQKYFVSMEEIPEIGGKIISIAPEKLLLADVFWLRKLTYMILAIAAALLSVPFLLIINNITSPIGRLLRFIGSIRRGDLKLLEKRLALEGFEEIEIVSVEFNNMLDEIDKLTQGLVAKNAQLYETELAKKQSELAYLKSQINPHFLYNTLEAMKGSAYDEGAERTAGMAKALAAIFRYSVKGDNIVTLMDELNIVKSYVRIQQLRFDDKFDVSYEFSNEALACRIPKMLLQPIVENAVFHGLEAKMERGSLTLKGYLDVMRDLIISVEDDGLGIEEQKTAEINEQLENSSNSILDSTSIGIFNVNNRIKLTYGEKYGIKVYSVLDKGTKVILKLPTGEAAV